MALDYFDASINRVSAWAVGFRSWQKALLAALCTPDKRLKKLQDEAGFTELMVEQEAIKLLPLGDIWEEYCRRQGVPEDRNFFAEVKKYEEEVLLKR